MTKKTEEKTEEKAVGIGEYFEKKKVKVKAEKGGEDENLSFYLQTERALTPLESKAFSETLEILRAKYPNAKINKKSLTLVLLRKNRPELAEAFGKIADYLRVVNPIEALDDLKKGD